MSDYILSTMFSGYVTSLSIIFVIQSVSMTFVWHCRLSTIKKGQYIDPLH